MATLKAYTLTLKNLKAIRDTNNNLLTHYQDNLCTWLPYKGTLKSINKRIQTLSDHITKLEEDNTELKGRRLSACNGILNLIWK